MSRRRLSRTLVEDQGRIACMACNATVGVEGQPWKSHAALNVVPFDSMPGSPLAPHPRVVLRRFSCPGCGALLDAETALPEDPFLDDVLDPIAKDT